MRKQMAYFSGGFAILWIILIAAGLIGSLVRKDYQLWNRGVETQARVTDFEPNNHCMLHYSYNIKGLSYQGLGSGENLPIGSTLTIRYLPDHPEVSRFGDPSANFWNDLIPISLFLITAPFFIFLGLSNYLRKESRPSSPLPSTNPKL